MVGLPNDEIKFKPYPLRIGSIQDIKDMLELASKKNVRPVIQKLPMSKVNEGIQMVAMAQCVTASYSRLNARAAARGPAPLHAAPKEKLDKILVANRGEIAKLGIKTVAVYSEPDVNSVASYLSIPKIVEAVKATGAQAVHPGTASCARGHWGGVHRPGHEAIQAMGDKIESKQLAMDAASIRSRAARHARRLQRRKVRMGYRLSKEEAASSFGDDRMFLEKFTRPTSHEIQLIADSHGNVVALPERECSIQRQAPSVLLDPETRLAMGKQAAMLAKKVGYVSAGGTPRHGAYSKVDLVEQMIRVAAGHEHPRSFEGPGRSTLAMESRVYAEDPLRGFLPSIGRLLQYEEPAHLRSHHYGKDRSKFGRMKTALDNYVIRGPGKQRRIPQDVYRHPRFVTPEVEDLRVVGAIMHLKKTRASSQISGRIQSTPQKVSARSTAQWRRAGVCV
ncbi:Pre-ATP-grasp domain [Phytophthora cactorum]|nr:Pre-ATP-grasp domain [Phytophthora cactorum]